MCNKFTVFTVKTQEIFWAFHSHRAHREHREKQLNSLCFLGDIKLAFAVPSRLKPEPLTPACPPSCPVEALAKSEALKAKEVPALRSLEAKEGTSKPAYIR